MALSSSDDVVVWRMGANQNNRPGLSAGHSIRDGSDEDERDARLHHRERKGK